MVNGYYIDFNAVGLSELEEELEHASLIPSRKILQEDLHHRFAALRQQGLSNLNELMTAVKTPEKLEHLANRTGISVEYLTILKREIASSQPKPVSLDEFPGVSEEAVRQLSVLGMKNTLQLFEAVRTKSKRESLCEKTGIPYQEILELSKLTDLVRIKWVGANFARLLADSGCDTAEKTSHADYREIYQRLMEINGDKKYFKGKFGENDMKLCVEAAQKVPKLMEIE